MIDLHTHTVFSDGELIPSELARRAAAAGYRALAITDHGDFTNLDLILPRLAGAAAGLSEGHGLIVLPGIELTHVPPAQLGRAVSQARALGAAIVVVHGETIVEPVAAGTNLAALEADIDILAHPGLITEEEARLAARRGICLELTCRGGHSLTNGHVVQMARRTGARLVLNTDSHSPGNLTSLAQARRVAFGAGLSEEEFEQCRHQSEQLVARAQQRLQG